MTVKVINIKQNDERLETALQIIKEALYEDRVNNFVAPEPTEEEIAKAKAAKEAGFNVSRKKPKPSRPTNGEAAYEAIVRFAEQFT